MNDRHVFINLPVKDLERTKQFFGRLGFTFNPKFTDDKAACMILGNTSFAMLLSEHYFKEFTNKTICDTSTHTEALIALSCESREAVDRIVTDAVSAGGSHAKDKLDYGFMYGWSFYDPNGHHWEVVWMDPATAQ